MKKICLEIDIDVTITEAEELKKIIFSFARKHNCRIIVGEKLIDEVKNALNS